MVTSALEGEGKSTTVANLAVALARNGRKVILADLDLRNPSLHRFFGLQNRPGLTQVALGTARMDDALARIPLVDLASDPAPSARNGSVRGYLDVLPSGPAPPGAGEFAHSSGLAQIMAALVDRADLVLVDAPPLLGVGDSVALSGQVDAILVVARLSLTRTSTMNELWRVVSGCPAPPVGLVVTGAEIDHGYFYSGYGPHVQDVSPVQRTQVT
jgi:non-specific protein-tyrosine kinase